MQGIDSDLIRGHIDTIILNILQEGDKYGYEIVDEVEKRSNGAYEIKQPTLYSCLKRLESQGLISSYWLDSDIGGKRHYYKLTDLGLETFNKNQEDWKRSRLIIDSLINNSPTSQTSSDQKGSNIKESNEEVEEEIKDFEEDKEPSDSFIFDKMDEEIENQDNGNDGESGNVLEPVSDAEKNGYNEVDDSPLAFAENDGDHIYEEKEQNNNEEYSSGDYDILVLLGHTSETENAEKENDEEENQTQQNVEPVSDEIEDKKEVETKETDEELDDLFSSALKYFIETDEVTVKSLQRRFFIGYARASKIMNQMEQKGYVSEPDENNERKLLITQEEYDKLYGEKRPDPILDDAGVQENEILEKFITGKYSEYNPDRVISEPEEATSEVEQEEEPAPILKEEIEEVSVEQPEEVHQFDDSVFEDDFTTSSNLSYFEKTPIENEEKPEPESKDDSEEIYDYSRLFKDETTYPSDEEQVNVENNENIIENAEAEENNNEENPYDDITYYNTDQTYYKSNVIDENDNNSYYQNEDDNDAIVMDFSNKDNADEEINEVNYDNQEQNEIVDYNETNEKNDELPALVNDQENEVNVYDNIDLTSVYDKGSDVDANYTDSSAKEKLSEIAPTFNDDAYNQDGSRKELVVDKTVSGVVTSEKSPKDLSLLKSNFEEEGIVVKPYYKTTIKPNTSTKPFIETNRIKMFRGWITFFIELVLLAITMLICNKNNVAPLTFNDNFVYYLGAFIIIFGIAMIASIRYWFNPYKKVSAKYAPRISHLFALLFTVQFLVIIYCVNLIIGFDGFNQIDYNHLNWIVPSVVSLYPIISSIVYSILYKSHNFHV